ncbi:glycosyltransferase family 2 protein [Phaeobacter sp. C3_T13_0]|uniref:glycosyltransferase family 2 protein n=1 Tax=Phaeobacter cretensis TaxID=3342641 RepID=UPI0039BD48CF
MTYSNSGTGSYKVLERELSASSLADTILLDSVLVPKEHGYLARLFFKSGTRDEDISVPDEIATVIQNIDSAVLLDMTLGSLTNRITLKVKGQRFEVDAQIAETDLFADLNVLVATRNLESAETTAEWIRYHVSQHGMQAAVILDRAQPDASRQFINELHELVDGIEALKRVVVLHSKIPLGKDGFPAEAHPLNAHGAPQRAEIEAPPPEPWAAPLGELLVYEIIHTRFLSRARSVANIDLCDLLTWQDGPNIFDLSVEALGTYTRLYGVQTYPWRVRKGKATSFADHICTQFDSDIRHPRWCVAPGNINDGTIWQLSQIAGAKPDRTQTAGFYRNMALRHPTDKVSRITPKAALVEMPGLLALSQKYFSADPVRMPKVRRLAYGGAGTRTAVVTTMKNEGPFILEWLAYHRAIGVDDFLVYTNDCSDGTDTLLQVLQDKGFVQHRDNPFREANMRPQHAAFQAAEQEPVARNADWLICMDVDEFINVRCGQGRLSDLFAAVRGANMISMTWRLFGNNDVSEYSGDLITREFTRCAFELTRRPHQAWGFKTLFRNDGIFKKLGVHRPKGLRPQLWQNIRWVNGSGRSMPRHVFRGGWRSSVQTYGYDLVQLNHYAVRSAESFLVKRDRGRVNHVERDQGLSYWFRMNNNAEEDRSIQRMIPALEAEMARLLADSDIAAAHEYCRRRHREKIEDLKQRDDDMLALFQEITGDKLRKLSRMHAHFCANVFLSGPEVIPNEAAEHAPGSNFFFSVERSETKH